jgi:SsrA-binding protein
MARKSSHHRRSRPKPEEKDPDRRIIATNRKARHNYILLSRVEAGLALLGSEVKSVRVNGADIRDGFARVEGDELWLHGVHIPPLAQASYQNHEPLRRRKCLVHRRELRKIREGLEAKGLTMVPLALYFKGVRVKVELALARGRRKGDQRAAEREKEDRRSIRDFTGR